MEPKLQRRVQRYGWDKAADYYERFWQRNLIPAQTRMLELAALKPGERVLEVACGTGLVTFPAVEAVAPEGEVLATDISGSMVEVCRETAKQRGLTNVSFERMDAEELTVPDASFDVVLCALGLMFVVDSLQAFKEQHRVLKPGGRAAAAVWGQRERCGWAELFPIVEARVASDVCPLFFQLGTQETMKITMEAAGFSDVAYERLPSVLRFDSEEEALGAAFLGGAVAMAYARFDEQTRDEVHADYLRSIEPYRNGARWEVPGEFVIAVGYKG